MRNSSVGIAVAAVGLSLLACNRADEDLTRRLLEANDKVLACNKELAEAKGQVGGLKRQVAELYPYGVYTIPEVSCVGLSEDEAITRGTDVVVGRARFADNVRGQIVGDRDGMVKLVFDRSNRRLIGCHVIGERASELVHVGQAVITLDGTVDTFIQMVFNHPTLGETFKYAAYDALGRFGPA